MKRRKDLEVELHRTELEQLRRREQEAAGQAQTLGDMTPGQRIMAVQNALYLKEVGWENATPEQRASLRAVAPKTARKMAEQAGENAPERAALRQAFPDEHRDNLKEIRGQVAGMQDKIQIEVKLNTDEIRKKAAEAVTKQAAEAMKALVQAEGADAIGALPDQVRATHPQPALGL